MKIAIAQINPTVGDIEGNLEKILSKIKKAEDLSSDIIIFSELSLIGYPPRDLLYNPDIVKKIKEVLR
ncbi:MAG TPA: nitrilase-related carbon-nitrogen hydrolase, partial [bacterium]|nr:nitrilase-related carbon-nitrogen hydrolase [bacterium]HPO83090.1 nitrilase-related carbon-nitrogen hydrolase [bacterium]